MNAAPPPPPPTGTPLAANTSLTETLWKNEGSGSKAGRSLVFIVLGGVVTVGLAMTMFGMIRFQDRSLARDTGYKAANFIRLKQDSAVNRRTRKMPKKVVQKSQPKTPTLAVKSTSNSKMANLSLKLDIPDTPAFNGNFSMMGGPGMKGSVVRDGEYMPIFRTKPSYPIEARDREVEGWVDVKFTVNAQGKVVNPKVVKAKPPSVFNRAALNCVKRWKYRAKVRDGKPVSTPGVVTRVGFKLRDAD